MAHSVSGLIRRAPHIAEGQNSNGNYTMFCFELSELNKGFNGTEDSYTNYSVALFAKTQAAIDFHNMAIAEGSFVVAACDKLMIDKQTADDGREFIKLKMMNARLDGFNNPNQQQGQPQQNMQQPAQGYAQQPQQRAQQPNQGYAQQSGGAPQQMQQPNQPQQMAQQPQNQFAQEGDIPF
ncbi:hypothetical protein [uncultured Alteromonas sp.]|mgnify:CR=1 FL=1|uniref:hypothetical protein n=1 Tax=uncultured Alteromonas sp. TaxID=179113 RepID=UPI0030EEA01A|tara:strand:- start:8189 stop:8728 length:540 start_codon:yes stop_codon:yes gene_type:complete